MPELEKHGYVFLTCSFSCPPPPRKPQVPLQSRPSCWSLHTGRSSRCTSQLCCMNYCQYKWQLSCFTSWNNWKDTEEEYSFLNIFLTVTTSPHSQLSSSLVQSCFKWQSHWKACQWRSRSATWSLPITHLHCYLFLVEHERGCSSAVSQPCTSTALTPSVT